MTPTLCESGPRCCGAPMQKVPLFLLHVCATCQEVLWSTQPVEAEEAP